MKNFIEHGDTINAPAPSGGVVSGDLVVIGSLVGVAAATAAVGVLVAIKTTGVFELPKVSAQAWTVGAPIYFDTGTKLATTVSSATTAIGYATEVAANPSAVGRVRLGRAVPA
jgi:predicted RecA/RadA family phage recombinase